jgi:hypothetical protein
MIKAKAYTTRRITASGKKFQRSLEDLKKSPYVAIGVQSEDGAAVHDGGVTMADLMSIHEFGTSDGHIPERAPIRSNDAKNVPRYKKLTRDLLKSIVFKHKGVSEALAILGEAVQNDIKAGIKEGLPPPNAPSTIARKGSSTPLIDTGILLNSIRYKVNERGD